MIDFFYFLCNLQNRIYYYKIISFNIVRVRMIELLKKNASRCIALVVVEIVVMTVFHIIEGEQFVISELLAL